MHSLQCIGEVTDFDQNGLVNISDLATMLSAYTSVGANWNGIAWVQNACNGETSDVTGEATAEESGCAFSGCMYPSALNYNPMAIQDAGACLFPGCTEPAALNYNVHANIEDGTCRFTMCPDFDSNGVVQLSDLMSFLGVYGTSYTE